jgi:tetratricopeptide (TPR) repeat protein
MSSNKLHFAILKEAYKSLFKKNKKDAEVMLEKITSTDKSPYPNFLLAIAYLFNDNFTAANKVITKLLIDYPNYMPVIHLNGFLYLKSAQNYENALSKYLELIEKHPDDKTIYKNIEAIRESDDFIKFQKKAKLTDFVHIPKPPKSIIEDKYSKERDRNRIKQSNIKKIKKINIKLLFLVIFILLTGVSIILIIYSINKKILDYTPDNYNSEKIDPVSIQGTGYGLITKLSKKKTPHFYYSSDKLISDFNNAKKLIKKKKYNKAILILNKIYNSNINFNVQEKSNFLIKFIIDIHRENFEKISPGEISQKPYLYRGYAVNWKGRVTNLKKQNNKQSFTLLIDYKSSDIFSGAADIFSEEIYNINNGEIVEVKGIFIETIGKLNRIYLVAKDIKKI